MVQTVFKSDFDSNCIENFYLNGSSEYIDYFKNNNLQRDYFRKEIKDEDNEFIKNFIVAKNKFHYKIDIYSNEQYINEAKKYNLDERNVEKIEIPNNFICFQEEL